MRKPIILWTADTKGWAYHNRIVTMNRAMCGYEHRVLMGECVPSSLWQSLAKQADVIVCQGIKWPERLAAIGISKTKMVLRLDSMRIDINGVYYDIFKVKDDGTGTQGS